MTISQGQTRALLGRNGAGKSTLVSVLTGLVAPDRGAVSFQDAAAPALSDRRAWRQNVACVYQKPTVVPTMTVAENIFLNRAPLRSERLRLIDHRKVDSMATELLAQWDIPVRPSDQVTDLSVEQRQLVEIARALSDGARFVILDEPTAQLEQAAVTRLFDKLRNMQRSGVTFLYISHYLEEIYELCDSVTVMRDGTHIETGDIDQMPRARVIEAMVGGAPGSAEPANTASHTADQHAGPPTLTCTNLTRAGELEDVSLDIGRGEWLGVTGLVGSGRVALGETIAGMRTATRGAVVLDGQPITNKSVGAIWRAGVGIVPEDRYAQGFAPLLSIAYNMAVPAANLLGRFGFVSLRRERQAAQSLIRELGLVCSGSEQPVGELSGGNQQKAVLGRALSRDPKLLVLINPTSGVDIASKSAIFEAVAARTRRTGMSVLVVSDELADLKGCDRVLVMYRGRIHKQFQRGWRDADVAAAAEGEGTHDDDH
jgi:simple sugar transport system ATP-binding protein